MRRRRSLGARALHAVEIAAVRLALLLTAPLPDDRFIRLAGAVGRWATPRLPPARRRVEANLRALGRDPGEARALAAAAGDNFCRVVAEYWRIDGLAARPDRVRVVDAAPLAQARARGRGVVIASAHFGNWEAIRLAARAATGEECALIYRAFNNPAVDAVAQRFIAVAGRPVLHKGREGTRALLRHVARGGTALVLVDQRQTGAPLLPFLGREAETATAAADLARRFDAALLTACARRRDDGLGFDVTFQAEATGDTAEAMMAEVNGRIGAWIDADPGQWFWLHRRWVRRGRGDRIRAARSGAAPQG